MFVLKKIVALFFTRLSLPGDLDPGIILPLGHQKSSAWARFW